MRHHLGKVVAGAAVALTGTAVMVAVTLPGDAGAAQGEGRRGDPASAADGPGTRAQGEAGQPARPGVVERAPREGDRGTGRDPLTDGELRRAQDLALPRTLREDSRDVKGRPGPERLTTDLAEPNPSEAGRPDAPRRAVVSVYDYASDTYVTKTVDLSAGKVVGTDSQRGVQPPPNREESFEAARLLIAAPLGEGLKKDYRHATGKELTDADQLMVTGFVYRGRAEGDAPENLRDCGRHRCVRLFTKVKNGQWIDTRRFVVDLSARTVGRLD
ncbi:Tat pathway signal sequence domain protein [Streptomyces sp. MST-110588]|nr:Tat pathway signal sequence domain protein [Streptomyces sp. MST-110588]